MTSLWKAQWWAKSEWRWAVRRPWQTHLCTANRRMGPSHLRRFRKPSKARWTRNHKRKRWSRTAAKRSKARCPSATLIWGWYLQRLLSTIIWPKMWLTRYRMCTTTQSLESAISIKRPKTILATRSMLSQPTFIRLWQMSICWAKTASFWMMCSLDHLVKALIIWSSSLWRIGSRGTKPCLIWVRIIKAERYRKTSACLTRVSNQRCKVSINLTGLIHQKEFKTY